MLEGVAHKLGARTEPQLLLDVGPMRLDGADREIQLAGNFGVGVAERELVDAVRSAAIGETYLNPRLGARVAAEPPPGPPDGLSEREVEVLRLVALGHTNAEIAEMLYLSIRTVETHRAHIQQKLRLGSRADLVRYALKHHLIEAEDD